MTTIELVPQVVARGDSVAPYRARKAPEAVPAHVCGYGPGTLVLRCHDLDLAVALLLDRFAAEPGVWDLDELVESSSKVWIRYVPNEYGNPEAGGVYERELRGTAGATPAILFAVPNPTKGTP